MLHEHREGIRLKMNPGNRLGFFVVFGPRATENNDVDKLQQKSPLMQTSSRFPDADQEDVPRELAELGQRIAALSGPQNADLEEAYTKVVDSVRRRRRILSLVQEALSQLRLDIKYLMFDLEMTRREREELRQKLNDDRQ